ncbi:sialidase family protein [Chitinophaga sancti]|uniref:sialidase family protein n=1 Tax=Chitinophaga sancti TaxID=1004 RepID=UPI002A752B8F|nr:sialidase family protein [Chitinophaga sancti]WPQ60304.1 sialidase family protein [Chitinophaga sancti]
MFRICCVIMLIALAGCKKSGNLVTYDDRLKLIDDNSIVVVNDDAEEQRKSEALVFKKDVLMANSQFPGGFGYPELLITQSGHWILSAVGHSVGLIDTDSATIALASSYDLGETWTLDSTLQEKVGEINISMPNMLDVGNNKRLLVFLAKNSSSDINLYVKASNDGGETWQPLININPLHDGYNVISNSKLIQLKSGRLLLPVAFAPEIYKYYNQTTMFCYYSDDYGLTWQKSRVYGASVPLQEPCVTELGNGKLLMAIRSTAGGVLFSTSSDQGISWSDISKSAINTPEAPETIVYSPTYNCLFMVWNNATYDPAIFDKRNPLTLAVSFDNGKTWEKKIDLENTTGYSYSYPSVKIAGKQLIITYNKYNKAGALPRIALAKVDIEKLIK